jgi:hypothetical protein
MKLTFPKRSIPYRIKRFFKRFYIRIIDKFYDFKTGILNIRFLIKAVWRYRSWNNYFFYVLLKRIIERNLYALNKITPSIYDSEEHYAKQAIYKEIIFILNGIIEDNYRERVGYDDNYEVSFVETDLFDESKHTDYFDSKMETEDETENIGILYEPPPQVDEDNDLITIAKSSIFYLPKEEHIIDNSYIDAKMNEVIEQYEAEVAKSPDGKMKGYRMVTNRTSEQEKSNAKKIIEALELEKTEYKRLFVLLSTVKEWF